ncbi:MAG: hypothetical protein ACPGJS_14500 [Flammeovirgaceae bacterium]
MKRTVRTCIYLFFVGLFVACQSKNEQNSVEKEGGAIADQTTIVRNAGEPTNKLASRAWAAYCNAPGGNFDVITNHGAYVLSYCGTEGYYQYFFLKRLGEVGATQYEKMIVPKNPINPTDEYYGFPSFAGPSVKVVDVNGDDMQEIVIGIDVSGKSSGAGAEEDTYWDETFYEVYAFQQGKITLSPSLTQQYIAQSNKSTEGGEEGENTFDVSEFEEMQEKLALIQGNYVESVLKDNQLHYGTCFGLKMDIGKHNGKEHLGVWVDQSMDGYSLRVNRITGNVENETFQLFCHGPAAPGEDGFTLVDLELGIRDGVHYLKKGDTYFVLDTDKDKIPANPEECEEESEGP